MEQYQKTEYLYHHGIPGQKWGIRRYQNKDGSLTPAGRKRAAKLEDKYKQITGKNIKKELVRKEASRPKTMKEMTNEELKEKTNRLRLENDYVRETNTYNSLHPQQISRGRKFIKNTWSNVISPAATEAGKNFLTNYWKKIGNDVINKAKEPDEHAKLKKEVEMLKLKKDKIETEDKIDNMQRRIKAEREERAKKEKEIK